MEIENVEEGVIWEHVNRWTVAVISMACYEKDRLAKTECTLDQTLAYFYGLIAFLPSPIRVERVE